MQSIRDIIDTSLDLGFAYFYGAENDQGYLRRMLRNNPSLEEIKDRLNDDISFISDIDEDYFQNDYQLKAFKNLKEYLEKAKKFISIQLKKKKKASSSDKKQIEMEIRSLERDFRNGLIEKDEYDYAIKSLLHPAKDNLDEVKNKFEEIDQRVKQDLKKYGYEEETEGEEFDEEKPIMVDLFPQFEEQRADITKLVDESNRRYTMEEFNDIYEDIEQVREIQQNIKQADAQKQKQALALSTMIKQNEQKKKAGARTPQQIAADQKNNAAKLQQLGVDPKLIAQLQADGKI